MNWRNVFFVLVGIIILVIFISGCTQLVKEKITKNTVSVVSQADQKIISDLMSKLKLNVPNYEASYKKSHEVDFWAGHSGATDYSEQYLIYINVIESQIDNYSMRYSPLNSIIWEEKYPINKEEFL